MNRIILFSLFVLAVLGAHQFPISRLAQLELSHPLFSVTLPDLFVSGKNNSVKIGSTRATVAAPGAALSSPSLKRSVVVISADELTEDLLTEVIDKKGAESVLILLPLPSDQARDEVTLEQNLQSLERLLLSRSWDASIFFAFEDEQLKGIKKDLHSYSGRASGFAPTSDHWHFTTSSAEPKTINEISVQNFQGIFRGYNGNGVVPTIAVQASYDSFSAAPGVSMGTSSSKLITILELSRLYSKLYAKPETRPAYNLLFVLNGGSVLNQAGLVKWTNDADASLLESVNFVLCIDDLVGNDKLQLHVSRVSRDENIRGIYESFDATAKHLGLNFVVTQRKINISDPNIYWPHEQFSRKKILAGTLSTLATPLGPLSRPTLAEKRISTDEILKKIRFVAESLSNFMYKQDTVSTTRQLDIFVDDLSPNAHFVDAWRTVLGKSPIVQAHLEKESPLVSEVTRVLKSNVQDFQSFTFSHKETDLVFYTQPTATMYASRVKPVSFDLIYSVLIAVYLSAFYAALKGPGAAFREAQEFINPSAKKTIKKKAN